MTVQGDGPKALEYFPCHYGRSRVSFRGPQRVLSGQYIAFLGASETFGRFIESPFVSLLERRLERTCVNFGVVDAGVDLFLNDPSVLDLSNDSALVVMQVMGAQNMSNRFYRVHPRRNDRLLRVSQRLTELYPEVDFEEFQVIRPMLRHLKDIDAERFAQVVIEFRLAWVSRMRSIITGMSTKVVLLWIDDHAPQASRDGEGYAARTFVTPAMITDLEDCLAQYVEVVASPEAAAPGPVGKVFLPQERAAAEITLGAQVHEEVAAALGPVLQGLLPKSKT